MFGKKSIITLCLGASLSCASTMPEVYKQCVSCHGISGEKTPFEQGKRIKDMSEREIINALRGYKAGTYGGDLKCIKEKQLEGLSLDDFIRIAKYINPKDDILTEEVVQPGKIIK